VRGNGKPIPCCEDQQKPLLRFFIAGLTSARLISIWIIKIDLKRESPAELAHFRLERR
jgi:hypothetical protein